MKQTTTISALFLAALVLGGCQTDEPVPDLTGQGGASSVPAAARLYIAGSRAGGDLVAGSAAPRYFAPDDESGPSVQGTCYADHVQAFLYTAETGENLEAITGDHFPAADAYNRETILSAETNIMGLDRYAELPFSTTCSADGRYKLIQADALAYTQADAGRFTLNTASMKRADLSLALTDGSLAPELYFGEARVTASTKGEFNGEHNTFFFSNANWKDWFEIGASGSETISASLNGRIYRIVGQVNLNMTEVPTDVVSRVELLATHYPVRIGLGGTHGTYYPVKAVTSATDTRGDLPVVLGSVDYDQAAGDQAASMSAFVLPSEVGMELSLRVTYREPLLADDGTRYTEKTFPLRPGHSYSLTGTDAAVYSPASADLRSDEGLYVYDGRQGKYCFYTYANVRVNLSGVFANVAAETGEVQITINVEPNFEEEHDYDII